jgi:hypothetical protein|tara:strand:- start:331 stop:627 length:297 start_codon:yes stop_codon:yes gene_type:complete
MKKLILTIAILAGLSISAQATTKTQACQSVEYLAVSVMEFKQVGGNLDQAIQIMQPNLVGLSTADQNYMMGVIAIAFESTMAPKSYGKAVYSNCLNHY